MKHTILASIALVASGCAAPAKPPAPASAAPHTAEGSTPVPDGDAEATPAPTGETTAAPAPREVTYRVTPEGLTVEVDGVEFSPRAKSVKAGRGWVVEITLEAKAGEPRVLLADQRGPLAFSAVVTRGGKETPRTTDQRDGESSISLPAGEFVTLKQLWPEKQEDALGPNSRAVVDVALWGLGATPEVRRPVKRFAKLTVKIPATGAPIVGLAPPDSP